MIEITITRDAFEALQAGWRNYVVHPDPAALPIPRLEAVTLYIDDGPILPEMDAYRSQGKFFVSDVGWAGGRQILTLFPMKDAYKLSELKSICRRTPGPIIARLRLLGLEPEIKGRWLVPLKFAAQVLRGLQAVEQQRIARDRGKRKVAS